MASMHQRPLSLRFESKTFRLPLAQALGVNWTGAAICIDICNTDDPVSYSRAARHYDVAERYKSPIYTYRKVVGQVDFLARNGLVEHDRRLPGSRGWQSAVRATPELRQIVAGVIGGERLRLVTPRETVILKDAEDNRIDYQDNRVTDRMRRKLAEINEAIASANLDPGIACSVARIFNRNFNRGGRIFAIGSSWQNMKSELRKRFQIDGEPVVEIDFCAIHPSILYAEAGVAAPADPYEITGWSRKIAKWAFLVLINATNVHQARHRIATDERMAALAEPGSQEAFRLASDLIQAIKAAHRPIAHAFHSDAGARLMVIDSSIAEAVLIDLCRQGIVALPVHDSFLVQARYRGKLEEAMRQAADAMGFPALKFSQK